MRAFHRLTRIQFVGECSSAALWPFAACQRRIVTPCSVLLFHPMRWQSEENVGLAEAAEWARHFGQLEKDMDGLLADLFGMPREAMDEWINPGRYVIGPDLAEAGYAELITLSQLSQASLAPMAALDDTNNGVEAVGENAVPNPSTNGAANTGAEVAKSPRVHAGN